MDYLQPGHWLGNNSIDCYLTLRWLEVRDKTPLLYMGIDATLACSQLQSPDHQECQTIWRWLAPHEEHIPMHPMVYHDQSKHYFMVVLNHLLQHVAMLGCVITLDKSHFDMQPE